MSHAHTIKTCRGNKGAVPFVFTVPDAGEWLNSRSGSFNLGMETHYSLYRRLGALESVWIFLVRQKSLRLTGIRTADRPARSLVSVPIYAICGLSWLSPKIAVPEDMYELFVITLQRDDERDCKLCQQYFVHPCAKQFCTKQKGRPWSVSYFPFITLSVRTKTA